MGERKLGRHLGLHLDLSLGPRAYPWTPDSTAAADTSHAEQRRGPCPAGQASQLPCVPTASL